MLDEKKPCLFIDEYIKVHYFYCTDSDQGVGRKHPAGSDTDSGCRANLARSCSFRRSFLRPMPPETDRYTGTEPREQHPPASAKLTGFSSARRPFRTRPKAADCRKQDAETGRRSPRCSSHGHGFSKTVPVPAAPHIPTGGYARLRLEVIS